MDNGTIKIYKDGEAMGYTDSVWNIHGLSQKDVLDGIGYGKTNTTVTATKVEVPATSVGAANPNDWKTSTA